MMAWDALTRRESSLHTGRMIRSQKASIARADWPRADSQSQKLMPSSSFRRPSDMRRMAKAARAIAALSPQLRCR